MTRIEIENLTLGTITRCEDVFEASNEFLALEHARILMTDDHGKTTVICSK